MNCMISSTKSIKLWKTYFKSCAPGKYHLNNILTFHLQNIYIGFGMSREIQPTQTEKRCQVAEIYLC